MALQLADGGLAREGDQMPTVNDICAWCGKDKGDHSLSYMCPDDRAQPNNAGYRFSTTASFKLEGEITFGQVPIGSDFQYYANGDDGNIVNDPTSNYTGIGRLCDTHNPTSPSVLVGWNSTIQSYPTSDCWSYDDVEKAHQKLLADAFGGQELTHLRGWWVDKDWKITRITNLSCVVSTASIIVPVVSGMNCGDKYCNTYNHYAVPNQPDGKTYLCYSCRQRG